MWPIGIWTGGPVLRGDGMSGSTRNSRKARLARAAKAQLCKHCPRESWAKFFTADAGSLFDQGGELRRNTEVTAFPVEDSRPAGTDQAAQLGAASRDPGGFPQGFDSGLLPLANRCHISHDSMLTLVTQEGNPCSLQTFYSDRMNMKFGERLDAALSKMKWGPKDLERASGVADSTISAIVRRGSDRSNFKELLIAGFPSDKISHDWLRTGEGQIEPSSDLFVEAGKVAPSVFVTVIGMAKMGEDGYYEEISSIPGAGDGYVDAQSKDKNAFALKVKGESMAPALRDGWYVVVEPNTSPTVGEYVLIKLKNGRRMVKELLYLRPDTVAVMSVNGGHRHTIDLIDIDEHYGIQAVVNILPPSRWKTI